MPTSSHLLASALVVDSDGSRVLLCRDPRVGRWGPVGGHVGGAETLTAAVQRVLAEATGLTRVRVVEPHLAVVQDVVPCPAAAGSVRHVDHLFVVVADPADPLTPEPGAAVAWFGLDALPDPLVPGIGMHLRAAARTMATQ
ncbi:MAG: NUDIX domain-containing protein [Actinomycetia bacterium]|nr:NUDIX domain-containing protein [Actinomycetes bacterium]